MNNSLYLRRHCKVLVEPGSHALEPGVVAALVKNIEPLGYTLSPALIERLGSLSVEQITAFYGEMIEALRALVGAHRPWSPMYPNFPQQVMEMSEGQLYLNAIIHYISGALPFTRKKERLPLLDKISLKTIELGSRQDFNAIFTRLAGSKSSLSAEDKSDLAWFVANLGDEAYGLLPPEILHRENASLVGALLMRHTTRAEKYLGERVKTATDVLRLAVALSEGDVSLAEPSKLGSLPRSQRRLLLGLLEPCPNMAEDMMRWRGRWLRLGERLHPGEFASRFPLCAQSFASLRSGQPVATFSRQVEMCIDAVRASQGDSQSASSGVSDLVEMLRSRPGDFARRLDHTLRLDASRQEWTLGQFGEVASRVSTPVLLQVAAHFNHRNSGRALRTFFPKGNVAKVQAIENTLPELPIELCLGVVAMCEEALVERFRALEPLGRCWVDPRLRDFPVPFGQRSVSKSLRTLARGSRLELPQGDTLRFFIWWKNGRERTDLDLSAVLYDGEFNLKDTLSYYNLKNFGGHHSGDITNAPRGAAEFIDVSLSKLREKGVRFVVMSVNSYTEQPFCDLPECFAGWMARQKPNSGEIFEPRTLQDRIDLASNTRICLPLIIDVQEHRAIWSDIALRKDPSWNNVHNNLGGVSLMLRAMTSLAPPNLFDLFWLHVKARGEVVESEIEAQQVFSLHSGLTPFEAEVITSQWL